MKTSLLILTVALVACACAASTPKPEETHANKEVKFDLNKVSTQLHAQFADEKFLHEKFGSHAGVNYGFGTPAASGAFSAGVVNTDTHLAGAWYKYIPWGTVVDVVVEAFKKATE